MSTSLHHSVGNPSQPEREPSRPRAGGRTMELELIPRLLAHARSKDAIGEWPANRPAATVNASDVDRFIKACLSQDEEQCPSLMTEHINAGVPLDRLCLDLLTPCARALGTKWEEDEVDFLEVTLGLGRMQRIVRDLGRRLTIDPPLAADAGQAFLCAMPEEQHSLGLAMLAEFFVADGWGVTVGPPLGAEDVLHEVGAHWYDVVGLSAGIAERIPRVTEMIRNIRQASLNANLAVMVGGRAFLDNLGLVAQVGADASAPDAAQGPMVARTLVQARRAALLDPSPPQSSPSQ